MIFRVSPRALLLCLACVAPPSVMLRAGGLSGPSAHDYRSTQWSAEHGLPQSNIKALAQTRDGYLWIGTLSGLARFDGISFKIFDHSNSRAMTRDAIDDLAADSQDTSLWIMTESELLRFHGHTFRRYGPERGFAGFTGQLWPARNGGVWFIPGAGQVARAQDEEVKIWNLPAGQTNDYIQHLVEEAPGRLIISISGKVFRFSLDTQSLAPLELPSPTQVCSSFYVDKDRSLWVCAENSLWRSGTRGWTAVSTPVAHLERAFRTSDGQIWATQHKEGRASLQWLVHGTFADFNAPDFPPEADVTRLLEDREGNLWVGTTTGLLQLQPKRIRVYSRQDGLSGDNTLAVTASPDGALWVGTAEGVSTIREGKITNLPPPETGADWYRVTALLADRHNDLWIGWKRGSLARWHEGSWQIFPVPAELGNTENLRSVQQDRQGRLWVGTGLGVFCRKDNQWTHFSTTNGLSLNDVRVIHEDRRGDLWFGTYGGGLNRLHAGTFTCYTTTNGPYNNRAWWIHEDRDGILWVGSQEGLNRFVAPDDARSAPANAGSGAGAASAATQSRFFTFSTQNGLHENVVNNVQEDEFGYLWLSGLRGVYRVARAELNAVAAGEAREVHCLAYGEADGMLSSECNGGDDQPAGCRDRAGHIWFPTARGVVEIDPAKRSRSEVPPPVVIEEVKADGEPLFPTAASPGIEAENEGWPAKAQARIRPGRAHVLEFHYTANTLVDADRAQFRYRLFGAENRWREATDQRTISYVGLRPGRYRFEVVAANHHGAWSPQPARFTFVLEPHFWQTWTFYTLCIIGTVAVAALIQAYRLKWQHRLLKLQEQHALASERARIARDLHDDLGTALTGLALQLDVARREAGANRILAGRFGQSAEQARDLAERMREVVWTINPRCDTVSGVATFLEQQVTQFLHADGLSVKLDFPEDIPAVPLGAQARHQLALSVREALTNVIRHARATEVVMSLRVETLEFLLEVKDNGCGFQVSEHPGHGLANMRTRMEQAGGKFECVSSPGSGTMLRFRLPLGPLTSGKQENK